MQKNLRSFIKLLSYPAVQSQKYYRFESDNYTLHRLLPRCTTELKSYDLSRADVLFTSAEVEEAEAAVRTLFGGFLMVGLVALCNKIFDKRF